LEFSDVLLYNFFEDSTVKNEWRVVLNGFGLKGNELRYASVCSELKFLYVGITRARNNLWIWDTSPWGDPMKVSIEAYNGILLIFEQRFWESRGLITIKEPGDPIPQLARQPCSLFRRSSTHWNATETSTAADWENTGYKLFGRKNYQQAVICFDRAGKQLLCEISRCFHLRQRAQSLKAGSAQRKSAFLNVADHFIQCAGEDHDQSQKCYLRAGECYAESGNDLKASDAFCNAKDFTNGALCAQKAGKFDRAADIVENHPVDGDVRSKIMDACCEHFLRQKAFK